jgi:DNA-binding response OmpR family regulator
VAKRKILVIDDDQDIRRLVHLRLRQEFDTVFATDAITAVSVAKREQPDLVLLDLGLPGGDGMVVMQRFSSMLPLEHIPIVIVSARDRAEYEDDALAAGARAFLQKPFSAEELLEAVRDALEDAV